MINVQLQIKLNGNINSINKNTSYDIKELRLDPKKCVEDIGNFIKNNTININNWNTMTNKIITILKNNYPDKSSKKNKQTSEYTKEFINKQTHLNYEIFGQKEKLITTNKNILIYNVFKAWKQIKPYGNTSTDTFLKIIYLIENKIQ